MARDQQLVERVHDLGLVARGPLGARLRPCGVVPAGAPFEPVPYLLPRLHVVGTRLVLREPLVEGERSAASSGIFSQLSEGFVPLVVGSRPPSHVKS